MRRRKSDACNANIFPRSQILNKRAVLESRRSASRWLKGEGEEAPDQEITYRALDGDAHVALEGRHAREVAATKLLTALGGSRDTLGRPHRPSDRLHRDSHRRARRHLRPAAPHAAMSSASAVASTSSHSFRPPAQVTADLAAARRRESSADDWQDATETSLDWLLSLRPTNTSASASTASLKGKERETDAVHWFCGRDGADGCWESAVFLIRLVAFKREGDVGKWRDQFDK